ncbi:MAG: hypothetical protein WBL25_09570 [Anaerolineales bacterium]
MSEMNSLRPSVIAAIANLFTLYERETITTMLIEECTAEKLYSSSAEGVERIQLAVLKLSQGNADKFLAAIELAHLDWRDVLVAAGFGIDLRAHLKWAEEIIE